MLHNAMAMAMEQTVRGISFALNRPLQPNIRSISHLRPTPRIRTSFSPNLGLRFPTLTLAPKFCSKKQCLFRPIRAEVQSFDGLSDSPETGNVGSGVAGSSELGVQSENFSKEGAGPEEELGLEDGSGGSGGDSGNDGGGGGPEDDSHNEGDKRKEALSMSQKLTLAYAALVGVGGLIGFLKSGSFKSVSAGLVSAVLLLYVYSQLPVNPKHASTLGAAVSALLLVLMGSRFSRSGKLFPAGVVAFFSFIMTGGYIHGILRSSHA